MRAKPISKEMILNAFQYVKSHRAAARYLNCSYQHYKKYAKLYTDDDGQNIFVKYKNQQGKGIIKHIKNEPELIEFIEGRIDWEKYPIDVIKWKFINEGYLREECNECGFNHRRSLDYKMPLLLHFKDNNKKNIRVENLELLCYNCFFLNVGDIFTNKQIKGLEDHKSSEPTEIKWELDEYHLEKLKNLGLEFNEEETKNDGEQYISKM
jgi:hypothetical protein